MTALTEVVYVNALVVRRLIGGALTLPPPAFLESVVSIMVVQAFVVVVVVARFSVWLRRTDADGGVRAEGGGG